MWVDIQTQLPTKLLLDMPLADEGKRLKIVYDKFEWDVPLGGRRIPTKHSTGLCAGRRQACEAE